MKPGDRVKYIGKNKEFENQIGIIVAEQFFFSFMLSGKWWEVRFEHHIDTDLFLQTELNVVESQLLFQFNE
jgi:hypothetical protein